jgi:hypothetical protein
MASERQAFWWRVDTAMRRLDPGDDVEIIDHAAHLVAHIERIPGSDGGRWRIRVTETRVHDPASGSPTTSADIIFGSAP